MAGDEGPRYLFAFGAHTDGNASMRDVLGGKGANLAEMACIGLPVPPGFTISADVCNYYYDHDRDYPAGLRDAVDRHLRAIEAQQGKRFGDAEDPLLVSVRSGARESMPGMMDTILNLGLNDETVEGLAGLTGNRRFAYDCYRRFIHMYGDVVLDVRAASEDATDPFEELLAAAKRDAGAVQDTDLDADALATLIERYKALVEMHVGKPFPQDVRDQLWGAIGAVFGSWSNHRAVLYRQRYRIPRSWGTAVNVQAMVFGNRGADSATGVAFTRNPATGERTLYGEYLVNAQGEDVVAGGAHAQAHRGACRRHARDLRGTRSGPRQAGGRTSATCRTSSSPSRTRSSTCSKPATASARVWRRCESRWRCTRRGCSTGRPR